MVGNSIEIDLYAAYRPNCNAIYDILSTNDGILVILSAILYFMSMCITPSKEYAQVNTLASWVVIA